MFFVQQKADWKDMHRFLFPTCLMGMLQSQWHKHFTNLFRHVVLLKLIAV